MIKEFKVRYFGMGYDVISEIYLIDYERDRFLLVDDNGWFVWAAMCECKLHKED